MGIAVHDSISRCGVCMRALSSSLALLQVLLRGVDQLEEAWPALVGEGELRAVGGEVRCQRIHGGVQGVVALPAHHEVLAPVERNPIVHLLLHALVPLLHVRSALVQASGDLHVLHELIGVLPVLLLHVELLLVLLLVVGIRQADENEGILADAIRHVNIRGRLLRRCLLREAGNRGDSCQACTSKERAAARRLLNLSTLAQSTSCQAACCTSCQGCSTQKAGTAEASALTIGACCNALQCQALSRQGATKRWRRCDAKHEGGTLPNRGCHHQC
mmetsp:Transcript_136182/g.435662  ORF Transcript_136182/g.435662 Transcript_136182/m.435662 type:complete len:274 (+) Transcript_136182:181-1002(+)